MMGERIRTARKARRMTMKELGEKLNLAESTIAGYEGGYREPSASVLQSISEILGTSTDYLLGRTNNPEPYDGSDINVAFIHGGEELTDDEKEHLEEELKRYRELKARFLQGKEKEQK